MHTTTKEIISSLLKKLNLRREYFKENDVPEDPDWLLPIIHLGDRQHEYLASVVLGEHLQKICGIAPYRIVISWSGSRCLYPWANEFWSPKNPRTLVSGADHFRNRSDYYNELFYEVRKSTKRIIEVDELEEYFNLGFTQKFGEIKNNKLFYPSIPSASILTEHQRDQIAKVQRNGVIVSPSRFIKIWDKNRIESRICPKGSWIALIKGLIESGINVLIVMDQWAYDLSNDFVNDVPMIYEDDLEKQIAITRSIGFVISAFSDTELMSVYSGIPCLSITDRRFLDSREIRDTWIGSRWHNVHRIYGSTKLFSSTSDARAFKSGIIDPLSIKALELFSIDGSKGKNHCPERYEDISWNDVRAKKVARFGPKLFLKIKKEGWSKDHGV